MPYTITASAFKPVDVWGSLAVRLVTLQPAASDYPTGGYVLTPGTNINLNTILFAFVASNPSGFVANWDQATSSLIFYESPAIAAAPAVAAPLSQVAANTDLSAFSFLIVVLGY
jgi:hypothetical protein